jgi:peptide/nickel transport system substrate-binding protein
MHSRKRTSAALVIVASILAACGTQAPSTTASGEPAASAGASQDGEPAAGAPLYGGTLVYADFTDFPTCNPAATSLPTALVNVFDGLARFNADFELQPELAESWDISEDGLTVTFNLRDGVSWHDGEPFTSEDVKFTWESSLMTLHPRGVVANANIESIDTPDDTTVVFNMSQPSPGFIYQIGAPESFIIPKHIYENEDPAEGPHATCQELPVGTGPFKAVEYVQGERFVMERNDDWWGTEAGTYWDQGAPYLDEVIVTFIPDDTARVNGFESGEFDFLYQEALPQQEVSRFQSMDGRQISFDCTGQPVGQLFFFNLRDDSKPWADLKVRQAIAWAIDRNEMNERAFFGIGVPSSTTFAPTDPNYNADIETYSPPDIELANQLLDEAGWPRGEDGVRFEMRSMGYDNLADWAEVLKQQLAEVGIEVTVEGGDFDFVVDKGYVQHDFDTLWGGLGVNDPGVGVSRLFRSDNIGDAPFNNAAAYESEEMDELWATYNSTFDEDVRRDAIFRIQELINEDLPVIYVNTPTNWASRNTADFAGWPDDCTQQYALLRSVWSTEGSPSR